MARFDVFGLRGTAETLALDLQADTLDTLRTTIVAPLVPFSSHQRATHPRINPRLTVGGEDYVMLTTDMSAIDRKMLGQHKANIEAGHRDEIMAAIDFLFTGF